MYGHLRALWLHFELKMKLNMSNSKRHAPVSDSAIQVSDSATPKFDIVQPNCLTTTESETTV